MNKYLPTLLVGLQTLAWAPAAGAVTLDELVLRQSEMRQDMRALEDRLRRLEAQLSNQGLLNLLNQMTELRAELARLRGQQEEQQHAIALTQRRQKEHYEDLDGRIKELASRPAPAVVMPEAIQLQPSRTLLGAGLDARSEAKSYEAALTLFRSGDYSAAVKAFQAFLNDFPGGSLASNAYYWLGLAHASLGEYGSAVQAYQKLINDFPTSNKVPDAMLSLARSRLQMGETAAAQSVLDQLLARYPQSRAAENARKLLATLK
jgi:tol-pal system protein YbgF